MEGVTGVMMSIETALEMIFKMTGVAKIREKRHQMHGAHIRHVKYQHRQDL